MAHLECRTGRKRDKGSTWWQAAQEGGYVRGRRLAGTRHIHLGCSTEAETEGEIEGIKGGDRLIAV